MANTTKKAATSVRTEVTDTLKTKDTTKAKLESLLGRPLGSPINGKQEGEEFDVTLTGDIQVRNFNGVKGAYYTTNEGYSIKVNAGFDPKAMAAGTVKTAKCVVLQKNEEQGIERDIKYCVFAD